ncbi:uncharacterized protein A4U43_C01F2910 [Asparagus officinalis]|uniref:Uncharacterized protein n=1 Tax=Asparagus officinalis TaxID=4686 RepID=A0A5P1FNT3_ASPOF|nr:uncharacterized protein A4U43_C01F2910 [Asparagus officinalis]
MKSRSLYSKTQQKFQQKYPIFPIKALPFSPDPEVSDLDLLLAVDEEIGRLDAAVDDLPAVEVGEALEHLAGDVGAKSLVGNLYYQFVGNLYS